MPNRIIEDSIHTSRSVNQLDDFEFRFWVYLITYVDDYGRGSADPELLRGQVFTRRWMADETITKTLESLEDKGMIRLYEVEGETYFCFPNWDVHQRIRAKKSKFPAPEDLSDDSGQQMTADDGRCVRNPIQSNPNPNPESQSNPIPECVTRTGEAEGKTGEAGPEGDGMKEDDRWEEFWEAYPRKNGGSIDIACNEYQKAVAAGAEPELLIRKARELDEETPPNQRRYIPAAEKWLRNRAWQQDTKKAAAKTNNPFLRLFAEEHGP